MDPEALRRLEDELGPQTEVEDLSDTALLTRWLVNEKGAPEILPFQTDLISRIESEIEYQEEQVETYRENPEFELVRTIYATELARVKYLLRAYLRARLHKIESQAMAILDDASLKARLSAREDAHAQEYFVLWGTHLKNMVAGELPPAFSSLVRQAAAHPTKDMVPRPDLDSHVFCHVHADLGGVPVDDEGSLTEFRAGDTFVIRYRVIRDLVASGDVSLL